VSCCRAHQFRGRNAHRDHPFIIGSTNASARPLVEVMSEAALRCATGDALQAIEDEWLAQAGLKLYIEALADALRAQTSASPETLNKFIARVAPVLRAEALAIAQREFGLCSVSFCDWDAPRTIEGYYRYRGGTHCAVNRAVAFAPYADLLWMETKQPILSQSREFADGVLTMYPDQWLAYNLSPSFNWDAAGLGDNDTKDFLSMAAREPRVRMAIHHVALLIYLLPGRSEYDRGSVSLFAMFCCSSWAACIPMGTSRTCSQRLSRQKA
jgi:isocitrate lyase